MYAAIKLRGRISVARKGRFGRRLLTPPKNPRSFCPTAFASALPSLPTRRSILPGSMQAIFATRTTDGAGNPARLRSAIATSLDQPSFSALVIIATQTRPCAASCGSRSRAQAGASRRDGRRKGRGPRRCRRGRNAAMLPSSWPGLSRPATSCRIAMAHTKRGCPATRPVLVTCIVEWRRDRLGRGESDRRPSRRPRCAHSEKVANGSSASFAGALSSSTPLSVTR